MTKQEFLNELQRCLRGKVPESVVQENLRYYERYIIEETQKCKNEHQVLECLGSPRLIAKTIIETSQPVNGHAAEREYEEAYEKQQQSFGSTRGFHADYTSENGWDIRIGRFRLNSWYGKLTIALIVLLIFFLIAQVFIFLAPVIGILIIICVILNLLSGR